MNTTQQQIYHILNIPIFYFNNEDGNHKTLDHRIIDTPALCQQPTCLKGKIVW